MWTDAARAAALATRQANAAQRAKKNTATNRAKQIQQADMQRKYPNGQGKPGPITKQFTSGGARTAAVVRNRLIHDAGRPAREAAAHQRQVNLALGRGARAAGAGLLGAVLGVAGALGKAATSNLRQGNIRR